MGIVKAKDLTFEYIRRDEEGNVIPEYDETIEIRIDTQSPTVTLEAPEGFFYRDQKGGGDGCGIRRWCMGKPG